MQKIQNGILTLKSVVNINGIVSPSKTEYSKLDIR